VVGHGMGVVDGVHVPKWKGWFWGFNKLIHPISLNGMFLYSTSKF